MRVQAGQLLRPGCTINFQPKSKVEELFRRLKVKFPGLSDSKTEQRRRLVALLNRTAWKGLVIICVCPLISIFALCSFVFVAEPQRSQARQARHRAFRQRLLRRRCALAGRGSDSLFCSFLSTFCAESSQTQNTICPEAVLFQFANMYPCFCVNQESSAPSCLAATTSSGFQEGLWDQARSPRS